MVTSCAVGLAGMLITVTDATAQTPTSSRAKSCDVFSIKAIHQEVNFKVALKCIYEALLDSKQFTDSSGGRKAEILREVGGTFNIFAGVIEGRNLELVPNRRIVQAWRVTYCPEGIYSIARFELLEQGSGIRIIFDTPVSRQKLRSRLRADGTRTIGMFCGNISNMKVWALPFRRRLRYIFTHG